MKLRFTLTLACFLAVFATGIASAETVWLDELNLATATQSWGDPHKNQSVEGHTLTIGGEKFVRGFGTHSVGELNINLAEAAKSFSASVGVDDEVNGNSAASVEFVVRGDGKVLWQSGVMRAGNAAKNFTVDLTGVKSLVLEVTDADDGESYDHADWADAKFETVAGSLSTVGAPTLPVVTPYILTPPVPATPRINGANVFGVRPGSPFMFTIPATGDRPMTFSADNLPRGLKLDPKTGHITGTLKTKGEFIVTFHAKNSLGGAGEKIPHRVRRHHRPDAADGLEQLELLCRRGFGGNGEERSRCDGQEWPHQSRLDLHQRG
ncbi:MAG: NPCBM/NEW2 domain-containing protein [Limisphaerales bacterium]